MNKPTHNLLAALLLLLTCHMASALEYRSAIRHGVILQEAPNDNAKKLYVVSQNTPLELMAEQSGWARVRTREGKLAWTKQQDLGKRTHLEVIRACAVYKDGNAQSPVVFRAEPGLLIEIIENTRTGWLRIRHRDGLTGFVRIEDVWGV